MLIKRQRFYEVRQKDPLVDLRTTVRRPVLLTNLAALMVGFGMMAQSVVVPQLLEMPSSTGFGPGQSIVQTGLWMAPAGLMMLVFSPISSALLTRCGGRVTLAIAGTVLAVGYLIAVFTVDVPWKLMLATCVASAGVGIGYAAMPTLIMDNVPRDAESSGVGVNALMRAVGTTIAGAVMAVVLTGQTVTADGAVIGPSRGAFQLCFLLGALAAGVAVVLTLCIPRARRGSDVPEGSEPSAEPPVTVAA